MDSSVKAAGLQARACKSQSHSTTLLFGQMHHHVLFLIGFLIATRLLLVCAGRVRQTLKIVRPEFYRGGALDKID